MTMKSTMLKFIFSLLFLQVSIALAQQASSHLPVNSHRQTFTNFDQDLDGYITYEEYLSWHEQLIRERFLALDVNTDDVLSQDEYSKISKDREKYMRSITTGETPLR